MPKPQQREIKKGMKVKDKCFNRLCEIFIVAPHPKGEVGVISGKHVGIFKKEHFWDHFEEVKS